MHDIDYAEVRRLRAMDMTCREIGKQLGTTGDVICKIVKRLGLPSLRNRTRQQPVDVPTLFATWNDSRLTVAEVARKLGITTGYLYRLADRHALPERDHHHRCNVLEEATPEEDEASRESLALAPGVQRRINELGIGMPVAELPDVPPWFSVTTEPGPYAEEWEDGYPYE